MSYRESEKYIRCSFSRAFRIYAQIPVKVKKKFVFGKKRNAALLGILCNFGFFGHFLGIIGIIDIINWFFINLNSSRSVYILKSGRKKLKIVFKIIIKKKKKKIFFLAYPVRTLDVRPSGTRTDVFFQVHGSRPIFSV